MSKPKMYEKYDFKFAYEFGATYGILCDKLTSGCYYDPNNELEFILNEIITTSWLSNYYLSDYDVMDYLLSVFGNCFEIKILNNKKIIWWNEDGEEEKETINYLVCEDMKWRCETIDANEFFKNEEDN